MTALTESRKTEWYPEGQLLEEPAAAGETIYNGSLVTRSGGYCKAGTPTAGEVFAGVADQDVDNASGSDGDKMVRLHKKGVHLFAAAGLSQDDVGKLLWLSDDQTVTLTPGQVYVGPLAYYESATVAPVDIAKGIGMTVPEAQRDTYRVPANVETAPFAPAAAATWEDYDLVSALNAALTTDILTGHAVELRGEMEFVNAEAAANNAKWGDGDCPDNDDTVQKFTTAAAAASEYAETTVVTDASGNIKIELDDITNLALVFHLRSFRYVNPTAVS